MTDNIIAEIGKVFGSTMIDVVAKTTGIQIEILEDEHDISLDEFVGIMSLNSIKGGLFLISAKEHDMRFICSYMLGLRAWDVSVADIGDVLCELVNMTAGNARLQFRYPEYMFTLTTPFLLSGVDMAITTKKRADDIIIGFGNKDIKLSIRLIY